MTTPVLFAFCLVSATLLCSLVAGFLLAFAVVAMPGIKNLGDREFIRAFQVIDGVIQNRQPVFIVIWLGSVLAVVASAALGLAQLEGTELLLLVSAVVAYLLGVQLPTFTVNVPLNNQLQTLDVNTADATACQAVRMRFEAHWNRWNTIRTAFAVLVSVLLILLSFKL
jgi:uncharacterized membrane protein